jgi:hypothetical protein
MTEKADLLGARLRGAIPEAASFIGDRVAGVQPDIGFKNSNGSIQLLIELYVFYLHILDRLSFLHLGPDKRDLFMSKLLVALTTGVVNDLDKSLSAVEFVAGMKDTYNLRQSHYVHYREVLPSEDKVLKGTLIWEFSKILFDLFDDNNPAILMCLSLAVGDCTEALLSALEAEKVLQE